VAIRGEKNLVILAVSTAEYWHVTDRRTDRRLATNKHFVASSIKDLGLFDNIEAHKIIDFIK